MVYEDKEQLLDFAKYFKQLYEKHFSNKAELSRVSGVSEATLSRIESASQKPTPETLKKLAPVLHVTEKELMTKAGYLNKDEHNNDLDKKFPDVMKILRRDGQKITPEKQRLIARIIETAIEDD